MKNEIVKILLVEDNPGDVRLTIEALKDAKIQNNMEVVTDGEEAVEFIFKRGKFKDAFTPDLILLDLNLPKMHGKDVLQQIKSHDTFRRIPVVILTTSDDEIDIMETYDLHANCYITKPVDLDQFITVVKQIENFWFTIVKLPD